MKAFVKIVLILVVFAAAIRFIETRIIYYPLRRISRNPADIGLEYRDVYFLTSDEKKINAWFIPHQRAKFTLLFSNGNAGNISYRLEKIFLLRNLGLNIFIYDYRGYGKSQGSPSEAGIYRDIRGAYDYLRNQLGIPADKIILYGESLGGAVAIDLAKEKPVRALITEGTFSSAKDMARRLLPFIPYFIFSSRFDNLKKIAEIKPNKLIIHSKNDEVVPFFQGKKLFEAAKEPKMFLELSGCHNTGFLSSTSEYYRGIGLFLNEL